MPRDNKKRGRRAEAQKRKHEDDEAERDLKRQKISNLTTVFPPHFIDERALNSADDDHEDTLSTTSPFYGLLDESELEYFRQADSRLENNVFEDDEDRDLFLTNIYREASGKELKMACSQSSSRLLERLIPLSKVDQLKGLFLKFSGQFTYLVQHRFASHCCESLFQFSAPFVIAPPLGQNAKSKTTRNNQDEDETMERLFLATVNELQSNIGFLITHKFASHALRVLLLVLSGEEMNGSRRASLLHSKKKERRDLGVSSKGSDFMMEKRRVPDSFLAALETMIRDSLLNLDTNNLRALATHTTGNPMLQILLRLELTHFGKQRAKDEESILRKLIPDDPPSNGTESAIFLDGLTYDPVGSRLLETIIGNAPGKTFKVLYQESWKYRMGRMVRNDVASYVAGTILERLSKEDLNDAVNDILPQIPGLAERGRTAIIKIMIERCKVRGLNASPVATALRSAYSSPDASDNFSIMKLLTPPAEALSAQVRILPGEGAIMPQTANLHASLLAQSMLTIPGPLSDLILTSLQSLSSKECVELAKRPTDSHVLQSALISPHASVIFRRKLIQHFYSHIGELALHPSGSHVVDAIYRGTHPGLAFIRERCAEELAENEPALRDSSYGRAVWRNWKMDLYKRRRGEWVTQMTNECGNDGFLMFPAGGRPDTADSAAPAGASQVSGGTPDVPEGQHPRRAQASRVVGSKSGIQLARERFARTRLQGKPSKSATRRAAV